MRVARLPMDECLGHRRAAVISFRSHITSMGAQLARQLIAPLEAPFILGPRDVLASR